MHVYTYRRKLSTIADDQEPPFALKVLTATTAATPPDQATSMGQDPASV